MPGANLLAFDTVESYVNLLLREGVNMPNSSALQGEFGFCCTPAAQGLSLCSQQKENKQAWGTGTCQVTAPRAFALTDASPSNLWWASSACALGTDPQMY